MLAWWERDLASAHSMLGVYWPLRGEPDLAEAYAALAARGGAAGAAGGARTRCRARFCRMGAGRSAAARRDGGGRC
ncbi:hypothetical protein LP419_17720 [Massilia sp. H-1]|nr:hypothetical protein LP419_17720 [Massilia sp. H-1]